MASASDLIVILGGLIGGLIPIIAGRGGRPRASRESIIGARVGGLREGYPGRLPEGEVELDESIAPPGYGGRWRCSNLGCGGWGCVYSCMRPGGERVAFKVPRGAEALIEGGTPPTVSDRVMRMVAEEARIVSSLNHVHLLRLRAYSGRAPILVYEYADQGSLEWQLSRGWRPGAYSALIGAQLADALRYIHSRGLVHGDVKPSNIYFSRGVVKLGDFSSLSRLLSATTSVWRGYTPGFRAPEQVFSDLRRRARERGVEGRADVYQLGVTLLYMEAGIVLDGEDAVDEELRSKRLASVRDRRLREAIESMTRPDPEERIGSEEAWRILSDMALEYVAGRG